MSTIGHSKPSTTKKSTSSHSTHRAPSSSKAHTSGSAQKAKAPTDSTKLSGEKTAAGKSPIDFGQNFGAKAKSLDLGGGTLSRGARGDNVKQLQEMLNAKGAKLETDGKFGPKTEKALKAFQSGQKIDSDGIVGKNTLSKLNPAAAEAKAPTQAAEQAQAQNGAPKPPAQSQPATGQTIPEPKVGTRLDGVRKSEPLPHPKAGGPQGEHRAKGTGYFPENSAMEGGFKDRRGKDLQTLQDYLSGKSKYVSVAMDKNAKIPYGKGLHIKELDRKYADTLKKLGKEHIDFRVVDTGGAFTNKGTGRIDIATANRKASLDPTINGPLTLQFQQ